MSEQPVIDTGERWDLARTLMLIAYGVAMGTAMLIVGTWAVVLVKGWIMPESLDKLAYASFTFLTTMAAVATKFIDRVTAA